jgi:hypothetical protein
VEVVHVTQGIEVKTTDVKAFWGDGGKVVVEQWNDCKVVTLASTSTGFESAENVRRQSQTGKK